MTIPEKSVVIKVIEEKYNCSLSNIKRKQIMFQGVSNGQKIVTCTPSSKKKTTR
ncbi:hypothetical protein [Psychrobacillus psychrotolerans]|uniref:hypothetical protein n=1 Tax=Psychrobacillus psychrotolerans TaxID=126156 RepID=UPI0033156D19